MHEFLILACSRLSDRGEDGKVKGAQKVGGGGGGGAGEGKRKKEAAFPLPSLLPFYFRVSAFSIQLARTTRSLEQANIRHILK